MKDPACLLWVCTPAGSRSSLCCPKATLWHGADPRPNGDAQDWNHRLDCGDVEAVLGGGECDHVLEGEARVGGQEHFYLEPNAAIVIPKEMDEIESYASTQVPRLDCL